MLRFILRILGLFLLAGAFAALVIDGTRSIAGGALLLTPLSKTIAWLSPDALKNLQPMVVELNPFLWDPVMVRFLMLPTWLVLGCLGTLIMALMRKRRPKIGFSSR
jgi:hypothetical protein